MRLNFSMLGIDFITMICFMLYKTITFDETAPLQSAPLRHGGGVGGLNLRPIILNKKKPTISDRLLLPLQDLNLRPSD